jgi:hypothetical protein
MQLAYQDSLLVLTTYTFLAMYRDAISSLLETCAISTPGVSIDMMINFWICLLYKRGEMGIILHSLIKLTVGIPNYVHIAP